MDVKKLNQTSGIDKIAKTNDEKERINAFKTIAKQEKNFAKLIQQKDKTEVRIKELLSGRTGEKIEKAYDKDGNLLFEKSQFIAAGDFMEKQRYYEYTDKETGNQVFFADFDDDGKMDYVRIFHGDNVAIEGYDNDDDGIFDEVRYLDSNKVFTRKADDPIPKEKVSSNNIEYKEGVDNDGIISKEDMIKAAEIGFDNAISNLVDKNRFLPECFKSPLKKPFNLIKKPLAKAFVFTYKKFNI